MRHPLQIHQAQQLGVQHFITRKISLLTANIILI